VGLDTAIMGEGDNECLVNSSLTTLVSIDLPQRVRFIDSNSLIYDGETFDPTLEKIQSNQLLSATLPNLLSNSLKHEKLSLGRINLQNVDWEILDATSGDLWVPSKLLEYLYTVNGVTNDGNYIPLPDSILTGAVKVEKLSTRFKNKYCDKWKELTVTTLTGEGFVTELKLITKIPDVTNPNNYKEIITWHTAGDVIFLSDPDPDEFETIDTTYTFQEWKYTNGVSVGSSLQI
jgi:hypothetical protein